ncbi:MAG: hypothetical protein Q4G55_08560 [bacterium]|nr:hypothetical protein [bacterium]
MDIVQVNTSIEVAEWTARRDALLADAQGVTQVTDNEELEAAGRVEAGLKKLVSKLAAKRKEVTSPIDELKKAIMERERALAKPLNDEISRVNALTTAYANELARRAREEQEAREAAGVETPEEAFGLPQPPALEPAPMRTQPPRTSSNRFVETWDFTVTNPRAVPPQLCSPDERKIRAFMLAKKAEGYRAEDVKVAGVVFTSSVKVYSK